MQPRRLWIWLKKSTIRLALLLLTDLLAFYMLIEWFLTAEKYLTIMHIKLCKGQKTGKNYFKGRLDLLHIIMELYIIKDNSMIQLHKNTYGSHKNIYCLW